MKTNYKITGCTSEDPVHPVSNLQNPDLYRMWQTHGPTKKAIVDVEFSEPTEINLVDIGNAGSAFVEVLVGKSESKADEMMVLVPIQSMMNLQDAKSNSNRSRTKSFLKEKFTNEVAQKKWDKMRVVCTQPFSSNPFGLSYLFVNSKAPAPSLPQSPSLSSQANKHNNNKTNNSSNNDADTDVDEDAPAQTKTPEAIKRENSALVEKLQQERKQKIKQTQGYDDVENLLDKNSKNNKKHKIKDDSDEEDSHNIPQPPQKLPGSLIIKPKTKDATATTPSTKSAKDQKADDNTPINTTLKGVVFAISGIQNPERGEIREKATALGAVYKQNWDDECTHLICKFANTPKYNEVKGKGGIIVTPQWILECHAKSRKLKLTKKFTLEEDQPKLTSDSTAEKKKKKKKKGNPSTDPTKGYDSDSNDDDDGKPNEYDYNDSFIDNSTHDNHESDDDDEGDFVPRDDIDDDGSDSDEDLNELVRESKAFMKKTGGLKKRPRSTGNDSNDDEDDDRHKKQKSNHNKHSHHEGKTFSKQHEYNNGNKKFEKKTHVPYSNATSTSDSDNDKPKHKKPTQLVDSKPKKPRDESGSGTETMADDEVKAKFKAMVFPDDPAQTKKDKNKQRDEQEDTPKKKGKFALPNDDSESGTEGMSDVDIPKAGVDHSDASDSDDTLPLDKEDLKHVLGALDVGGNGGDATLVVDAGTNWEELVTKKFNDKAKEEEKLGKAYPVDELPSFLSSVQAFFSGVARKNEFNLRKYIIAYDGKIDEYLGDETKYIFTERTWDRDFDDALKMNPNLVFVKPAWVFACHSSQKLLDLSPYRISK